LGLKGSPREFLFGLRGRLNGAWVKERPSFWEWEGVERGLERKFKETL